MIDDVEGVTFFVVLGPFTLTKFRLKQESLRETFRSLHVTFNVPFWSIWSVLPCAYTFLPPFEQSVHVHAQCGLLLRRS